MMYFVNHNFVYKVKSMRRNRVKPRLERKTLKRQTDDHKNKKIYEHVCQEISQSDITGNLNGDDDIIDIINQNSYVELDNQKIPIISDADDVIVTLKNIMSIMKNHNSDKEEQKKLIFNEIDPSLEFRFLNRKFKKNIFLPPIKTRLKWQNGEFPFFKTDVRYYNQQLAPYQNKRLYQRAIKYFSMKNMITGHYHEMQYPANDWPCKGLLYITNLRIFLKKTKNDSFYICFDNILSYSFYENCIAIEHLKYNQKATDIFYLDPDQARLLETIIQITL